MADTITAIIPYGYKTPTDEDVRIAKDYILRRQQYADLLGDLILGLLEDAAREIVTICYKYNIPPKDFEFSANKEMQEEVYAVMDRLEEEIMELLEDYPLRCSDDEERKKILLLWMLALGSKGRNLKSTLHERLLQFLYDLEAQIAAMRLAGYQLTKALLRIIPTLRSVYVTPEVRKAFKPIGVAATYLRAQGVHEGNVGLSSSGANNVIGFGKGTLNLVWMKNEIEDFLGNRRIAGYLQLRGSTYLCDACDSEVGFHLLQGTFDGNVMVHPNCCCYRIPIYKTI